MRLVLRLFAAIVLLACAAVPAGAETCIASFYGGKHHGRLTASGERVNQNAMTAAHRTRPFGSMMTVTNLANGRSVVVRSNDRGPFVRGRCVDLSRAAAAQINMGGLARVRVE